MLAVMLMLALSLPPAEVSAFAARVPQSLAGAMGSKGCVLLRVEDPGETGAAEQMASALRDALRQVGIEAASEGDLPWQLHIYLGRRNTTNCEAGSPELTVPLQVVPEHGGRIPVTSVADHGATPRTQL